MKPPTNILLLAALLFPSAGSLSAQPAGADPLSGTWRGLIGPGATPTFSVTLELKLTDKAVTGTVTGFPSPGEVKSGTFDPATGALKLELGPTGQTGILLVLEGTVVLGQVTGHVSGDGQTGTFKFAKEAAAAGAAPAGEGDAAGALRFGFTEVSGWVAKAAELVPADKYGYQPAPTVRSFAQQLGHLADSYNYYCARAAGREVQWAETVEKGSLEKATLLAKLKEAQEVCTAAYAGVSQLGPLLANVAHTNLHYGNLITYLRMLGLTPPSS